VKTHLVVCYADRLKEKVALLVGAGSIAPGWGNGRATAVAFAREGARVFCRMSRKSGYRFSEMDMHQRKNLERIPIL